MKHILLLIYIFTVNIYSQNDAFDPQKNKGNLYEYAEYTNVGKSEFAIEEILDSPYLKYKALKSENHNVGFTSDHHWIRFKLTNSLEHPTTYYLETARPVTDMAHLYNISHGNIQKLKSGDKQSFNAKQVKHRSTIFKLALAPHTTHTIYIHLKSDGETINLPLKLYDESSFWFANYKHQLFLGFFYGLLFLGGIIYLFFYSSLKEKTFLYYGLYVFSIVFMQAALDGFLHEYAFPHGGYINERAVLITALVSNFFLLKYCEHFLKLEIHLKRIKKAVYIIYGAIIMLFTMLFINEKTLEIAYPLSHLNGLITLLLILGTIFILWHKRIKIDPCFLLGILCLVAGFIAFVMNNLSLLPSNFYTMNSAKIGSGLEVVFLSLSMTKLIKQFRLEKEESQLEALKKSEEISAIKTYFMSNMSHELRTPLNAIMGIVEHELETIKNHEERKSYQTIKNASLSLLSNINDIIDFEKIENNKLELNAEDFNPCEILDQISNNWKIEAEKKGLDYRFDVDPQMPTSLFADGERFNQIINNVLSNAIKYTEKGGVLFKINCFKQPNDSYRFSIQISDTGIGIPLESQNSIFDSFSQMKHNHKRKFGGIGLGLSIVKHIVELFEGSMKVESKPGRGTDVFIDLILKNHIPEPGLIDLLDTNKNKALHILIVEDNKINQMVMQKILKSFSKMSFTVANNGQEAIDALQKDTYHLILMDLQMPIMDGYEATKIIRSGTLGKTISKVPIIAVTADALQETKQRVLKLGMDDYITKPVNKNLLLKKIHTCNFNKPHYSFSS
ncbi:7TM diverse intracellular signaling domain-containing protein [Mariniflexile ostreae]|uniref:histidine kinase n=1 Tax=Mariniflexile ostreae TaxID=1520892 RepID=A0ABV5F9K7_9FLAO